MYSYFELYLGEESFDHLPVSQTVKGDDPLEQWFSTSVRPRPGKFSFYKTRARYRAAARRLRNTALEVCHSGSVIILILGYYTLSIFSRVLRIMALLPFSGDCLSLGTCKLESKFAT
jgi:hypothetical protein